MANADNNDVEGDRCDGHDRINYDELAIRIRQEARNGGNESKGVECGGVHDNADDRSSLPLGAISACGGSISSAP